ncbi:MAG: YebC/PmpR family DNA-binding transcriptional regulator [Planctomycetota bacterium]|jgi:YebC/PmpR family DNA-binding regulatory protein
MGRQWLQKNKEINANKRAKITTKLVREITVAAKMGTPEPEMNPRLAVAIEAARKQSVSNDVIQRAIKKATGSGADAGDLEHVTYEGMAPHKVPVIVECMTDNRNRTAPDIRALFKKGQFGSKVGFFFEHLGIVEATHPEAGLDPEDAAIEAGAQSCEELENVPEGQSGARFLTEIADLDVVTQALREAGWIVTTSEIGYVPKDPVALGEAELTEVEDFLDRIDDHDDTHRIYAAYRPA